MGSQNSTTRLRHALVGNAMFSASCGLILLAFSDPLAASFGVLSGALVAVGVLLLPFAVGLAFSARRTVLRRGEVWLAISLDVAWVLGSAVLLVFEPVEFTATGVAAIVGVAACVSFFSVLQTMGVVELGRCAQKPG